MPEGSFYTPSLYMRLATWCGSVYYFCRDCRRWREPVAGRPSFVAPSVWAARCPCCGEGWEMCMSIVDNHWYRLPPEAP
jgi:hypothetical protein